MDLIKLIIKIIRWIVGIFILIFSIVGFFSSQEIVGYVLASIFGLLAVIVIPYTYDWIFKRQRKIQNIEIEENNAKTKEKNTSSKNKKVGFLDKQLIKNILIDNIVKNFPDYKTNQINLLIEKIPLLKEEEIEKLKNEMEMRYDEIINYENVNELGEKYLNAYSEIFSGEKSKVIENKINTNKVEILISECISNDDALDPDELQNIINYSKKLGVDKYDTIDKLRNYFSYPILNWELDNGIFPNVKSDFILQKNEQCFYSNNNAEMFTRKQVTTRVNYGGPKVRLKIAKGLSYNLGSYNVQMKKELKDISHGIGVLNLTNKRILFKNSEKNTTIRLSAIVDIEPYSDSVVIYKSSGNPLIFKISDGEKFYQLLNAAIKNY